MNFKKWVIINHLKNDTPEGDFAEDLKDDKNLKGLSSDKTIFNILDTTNMSFPAKEVYNKLKETYLKEK